MNWVTLSRILHFHTRLPYLWTHTYGHLVHYQVHADVLMDIAWHASIPQPCPGGYVFVEAGHWGAGSDAEYAFICLSVSRRWQTSPS